MPLPIATAAAPDPFFPALVPVGPFAPLQAQARAHFSSLQLTPLSSSLTTPSKASAQTPRTQADNGHTWFPFLLFLLYAGTFFWFHSIVSAHSLPIARHFPQSPVRPLWTTPLGSGRSFPFLSIFCCSFLAPYLTCLYLLRDHQGRSVSLLIPAHCSCPRAPTSDDLPKPAASPCHHHRHRQTTSILTLRLGGFSPLSLLGLHLSQHPSLGRF